MTRLLCLLGLLLASVWLGTHLQQTPGYILLSTPTWTVEMTLWMGGLSLLIVCCLFHLICLFFSKLIELPHKLQQAYRHYKQNRAQAITRQGLIEFSEGYWKTAERHLIKALPHTDIPLFNYLMAARAAQERHQLLLRDHYLREAQQMEPQAKIAVKLTQAQLQITAQQWEQALATLQHLHEIAPKHPYVLTLLAQLYETVKDWSTLLPLLPRLQKHTLLSPEQFSAFQHRVYLAYFQDACKQPPSLDKLTATFQILPKPYRQEVDFLLPYCRALSHYQAWDALSRLLKPSLSKKLQDDLLWLYVTLPPQEEQLAFVKSLLKTHPHAAMVHFCLGYLNLEAHLFGQARHYFEQSLAIQPHPRTYFYLGKALELLAQPSEACAAYKQGLQGEVIA